MPIGTPTLSGIAGDNQNILNWNSILGADSYNVYRFSVLWGNVAQLGFTDHSAQNGVNYQYQVAAVVSGQEGPKSNVVSLTPEPK